MKLMTLEEFKKTPNYTLFSVCTKENIENGYYSGDILMNAEGPFIKTGQYNDSYGKDGWNGVIDLFPDNIVVDQKRSVSNWCSWDNADADYTDEDIFIVYESNEIQQMINILLVAIGESYVKLPDSEKFYVDEKEFSEKELFEFAGLKNNEKFDYGHCDSNLYDLIRKYVLSTSTKGD